MVSIAPAPRISFAPARTAAVTAERATFPRLMAPVLCRPARFRLVPARPDEGAHAPGVRIYSDEAFAPGEYTKAEIFLRNGQTIRSLARVAWINELAPGGPAKYDVGLELYRLRPDERAVLPVAR